MPHKAKNTQDTNIPLLPVAASANRQPGTACIHARPTDQPSIPVRCNSGATRADWLHGACTSKSMLQVRGPWALKHHTGPLRVVVAILMASDLPSHPRIPAHWILWSASLTIKPTRRHRRGRRLGVCPVGTCASHGRADRNSSLPCFKATATPFQTRYCPWTKWEPTSMSSQACRGSQA